MLRGIKNILVAGVLSLLGVVVLEQGVFATVICPAGTTLGGEAVDSLDECDDDSESSLGTTGTSESDTDDGDETSESANEGTDEDTAEGADEGTSGGTDTADTDNTETASEEDCGSMSLTDEQIASLKTLMERAGYDINNFRADAVKIATSEINLCDGMSRAEARTLLNAMGLTDVSDEEVDAFIESFMKAYNKTASDETTTIDEVLETKPYIEPIGAVAPNTGVNTGEFNGIIARISLGTLAIGVGVGLAVYRLRKRQKNFSRVGFKK